MHSTTNSSHKVIRSKRVPQITETSQERINAGLWTAFVSLTGLCVTLIILWTMLPQKATATTTPGGIVQTLEMLDSEPDFKPIVVESPQETTTEELESSKRLSALMKTVEAENLISKATAAPAGIEGDPQDGESLEGSANGVVERSRQVRRTWLFDISIPLAQAEYHQLLLQMELQLAAVFEDGRIVYLHDISGTPSVVSGDADNEKRFFTQWSNGNLLQFDRDLFQTAGVDISNAKLIQLFSDKLEARLAKLESATSEQSQTDHRTWFSLVRSDNGFEFQIKKRSQN